MITLALSKGRIFEEALPLLAAAGIEVGEDPEQSRKLILGTSRRDVRLVLVRASDVPTYVQHGGADLGVVGQDTLIEHGGQGLYLPLDLKIGLGRPVPQLAQPVVEARVARVEPAQGHAGRRGAHRTAAAIASTMPRMAGRFSFSAA
jgi:ATP phosphoribosyltransferase